MEVEREIMFPAEPDEVWEALTEPERLEEWFATEVELDPRPGGEGVFRWGDGEERRATVREVEEPSGSCSTGTTTARSCSSSRRSRAARACTSSRARPTSRPRSSCARSRGPRSRRRSSSTRSAIPDDASLVAAIAARGDATATELAAELPVTRQAVAKQLATLADAGLLSATRSGRETRYAVTPEPLDDAVAWMVEVGARWDERLAELAASASLGREPLADPALALAAVAEAVVQPAVAVLPELPRVAARRRSRPSTRAAARIEPLGLGHRALELLPRDRRSPRSAATRARRPARRGGRPAKYASDSAAGNALDLALDADLAAER